MRCIGEHYLDLLRSGESRLTKAEPLKLFVELPGLSKKDVELKVDSDKYLTLRIIDLDKSNDRIKKFSGQKYSRYLGGDYDLSKIEAKMENGLLTILVPVLEKHEEYINIIIK